MAMKVYGDGMSACVARVLLCLHEKETEFDLVPVDLFACHHKLPSFLAMNPFGQVPVLQDDDLTLFESRAITAYIADKHKEKGTDLTRHADAKEAAIVKLWSEVESHHFNPAISAVIHQLIVVPLQGESPNAAIVEENLEKLGKVLDVYEERLGKTKYLAGDSYTLADLHHVPYTYYFMKTSHAGLVNDRPNVKAWWEDLCSRPAFLKVSPGLTVAPVTS
ncbi:Glutathione S-transferase F13 [Raphanus sativus]|uniref:glutathione transferase n=1 Tax=Raphanus sativus TaxID=3726 RepID=A0A6J0NDF6_RAPSA|nr:glutathione S-transferase F13 [Raphanus sativus]XP_056856310.1 glutathione S-transferase F13 [Raphanus sativus]KAJ4867747.1 Glutathione S-transferase F13 [Raphanus sativus]KAJ4905184.1 Glutathione S-transferase F13 [Raphanus sativus]